MVTPEGAHCYRLREGGLDKGRGRPLVVLQWGSTGKWMLVTSSLRDKEARKLCYVLKANQKALFFLRGILALGIFSRWHLDSPPHFDQLELWWVRCPLWLLGQYCIGY